MAKKIPLYQLNLYHKITEYREQQKEWQGTVASVAKHKNPMVRKKTSYSVNLLAHEIQYATLEWKLYHKCLFLVRNFQHFSQDGHIIPLRSSPSTDSL